MKKILAIIFLIFLWCETSNAEDIQLCKWVVDEAYADVLKKFPKEKRYFYAVKGDDERCEYGHNLDEKEAFNECERNKRIQGISGTCKLFAIGKKKLLNIKKTKAIFDSGTSLFCNTIKRKDPTTFKKLFYVDEEELETLTNKELVELKALKAKDGYNKTIYTYEAYDRRDRTKSVFKFFIFKAEYERDNYIWIRVNTEFKTKKKAEKQALKYAKMIGQLPYFLLWPLQEATIHKGNNLWGGASEGILIHTAMSRKRNCFEEIMIHEAAHASVDTHATLFPLNLNLWRKAQNADIDFISQYAKDFPEREDVAETIQAWIAARCKSDRISKSTYKKITKGIPNRLKYLDEQNYDLYPMVCK